MKVLWIYWFG